MKRRPAPPGEPAGERPGPARLGGKKRRNADEGSVLEFRRLGARGGHGAARNHREQGSGRAGGRASEQASKRESWRWVGVAAWALASPLALSRGDSLFASFPQVITSDRPVRRGLWPPLLGTLPLGSFSATVHFPPAAVLLRKLFLRAQVRISCSLDAPRIPLFTTVMLGRWAEPKVPMIISR